jgi:hypothetical protein
MCALLKPGRVFIIPYRSSRRSIFPLDNFSIFVASLLDEDMNAPTSESTSELPVLALLFGLVAEDGANYSSLTVLGIALLSHGVVGISWLSCSSHSVLGEASPELFAYFLVAMLFSKIKAIAA